MNLLKELFAPLILVFRRRIRRKWRRYTFLNRELISPHPGRLPLPPGIYRFRYEWWEVSGCPKIGETATEYWVYVRKHGKVVKTQSRTIEIEEN